MGFTTGPLCCAAGLVAAAVPKGPLSLTSAARQAEVPARQTGAIALDTGHARQLGRSSVPHVPLSRQLQEMPCPHCERVFKQADRLKQHIQKQHADVAAAADAGASSSSSAGAAAAAAEQPPKVLAPAAVAAVGAAAAAAVKSVAAAGKPGKGDSRGDASAGAASTSAAAPASAAAPKLMDIGSRAGYYEAKSPKLLLHEWCLREKAPRPRYRASQAEGGLWKCKVGSSPPQRCRPSFQAESAGGGAAERRGAALCCPAQAARRCRASRPQPRRDADTLCCHFPHACRWCCRTQRSKSWMWWCSWMSSRRPPLRKRRSSAARWRRCTEFRQAFLLPLRTDVRLSHA